MIHTHTQKKFDEIKNKKKKDEEAEQGVNYLSQEKQKRRRNDGDTKKPTIYYTQTHSLIGGKAEKKIVFFLRLLSCRLKSCTKPPKLYLTNNNIHFFLFVWRE